VACADCAVILQTDDFQGLTGMPGSGAAAARRAAAERAIRRYGVASP
jgi:hypothetical protein